MDRVEVRLIDGTGDVGVGHNLALVLSIYVCRWSTLSAFSGVVDGGHFTQGMLSWLAVFSIEHIANIANSIELARCSNQDNLIFLL